MISTSIEFDLLSKTSTDTLSLYLCNCINIKIDLEIDCVTPGEGGRKGRREIEGERRTVSNTNILLIIMTYSRVHLSIIVHHQLC